MSVQYGKCNFEGSPVAANDLRLVRSLLEPYGPDGEGSFHKDNVGILYRAFHTTRESHREEQPHITPTGRVITWDGRLDNREELISLLGDEICSHSTDLQIVGAAYDRWGSGALARYIGDWAVSVWDASDQSLVLARDFMGTRHLYYRLERNQVTWSTTLEPLVLLAGQALSLNEEYVAGWLTCFPAPQLTPYLEIDAVPPSCFVRLARNSKKTVRYWQLNPSKRICYRSDSEYEEHFRSEFEQSVRRRLRSDKPILAELSGGMDSSSIVCVADAIIAKGPGSYPRLDTLSFYDDSEPNWNERPYFTVVEERRGRAGHHIDVSAVSLSGTEADESYFAVSPASIGRRNQRTARFADGIIARENRVILSGTGGDEFTGGVPTAIPELADLLARGRLPTLVRRLNAWALHKRQPWFHLLFDAAKGFLPPEVLGAPGQTPLPAWLRADFVKRNRSAIRGYETRWNLIGALPSFQEYLSALHGLQRQLGCVAPPTPPAVYEKRYPYLDRSLLEFLCAIPREQMVRPGQRRSLMRRALAGVVPGEILNRKSKAFVLRSPIAAVLKQYPEDGDLDLGALTRCYSLVDVGGFAETLRKLRCGQRVPVIGLLRLLSLKDWLDSLERWDMLPGPGMRDRLHASQCVDRAPRPRERQQRIQP